MVHHKILSNSALEGFQGFFRQILGKLRFWLCHKLEFLPLRSEFLLWFQSAFWKFPLFLARNPSNLRNKVQILSFFIAKPHRDIFLVKLNFNKTLIKNFAGALSFFSRDLSFFLFFRNVEKNLIYLHNTKAEIKCNFRCNSVKFCSFSP